MNSQDKLRQKAKIVKALSGWTFKDMSEVLNITSAAFYNWLNKSYNFSYTKEKQLQNLLDDLLD